MTIDWPALAAPFPPDALSWRVGSVTKAKDKATLLVYIDARNVMDRLDEVAGPENWQATYHPDPRGAKGLICRISIRTPDGWVAKEDGAGDSDIEAVKGGFSDSFKRAAVKWGIGRYLYAIDSSWHRIEQGWANGKGVDIATKDGHLGWVRTPTLPAWAIPGAKSKAPAAPPREAEPDRAGDAPSTRVEARTSSDAPTPAPASSEPATTKGGHHPSWDADRAGFSGAMSKAFPELKDAPMAVAAWCESTGRPRPSAMDAATRGKLRAYIGTDAGQQKFWAWHLDHEAEWPLKAAPATAPTDELPPDGGLF